MEIRKFGKTGFNVSVLTLGGCAFGWLHEKEPDKAYQIAEKAFYDCLKLGVNIVDVAPSYGEAELRLGPFIHKNRNKLFLAEKTMERTKKGAWEELNHSLERLQTEYFDLYQFHAVSSMEELNQIFDEDGAIQAFKEAKDTGLIRNIGITCHNDMRIILKALDIFDEFSTILLPVYIASMVDSTPINDFRPVLKIALERNIGINAIKAIARRRWLGEKSYGTWYEPLTDQKWIDDAVCFTLSQEGVSTYSLPCDLKLWPFVFNAAKNYKKLSKEEQNQILEKATGSEFSPLFPD